MVRRVMFSLSDVCISTCLSYHKDVKLQRLNMEQFIDPTRHALGTEAKLAEALQVNMEHLSCDAAMDLQDGQDDGADQPALDDASASRNFRHMMQLNMHRLPLEPDTPMSATTSLACRPGQAFGPSSSSSHCNDGNTWM